MERRGGRRQCTDLRGSGPAKSQKRSSGSVSAANSGATLESDEALGKNSQGSEQAVVTIMS